ncbi:integration host factor subunit alpha [Microvirga sp. VF16]|uniref:integration host factor subunit alpha n=1 Tax=Microvirga sp. VF16 TaxID=2807101 RepID=UPI00193C9C28|nr:integration host factor subunit alpha [Microvirga sp. VF16]QRM35501.1 integration host factor subunit alpha [Microvirga sp. VF16]
MAGKTITRADLTEAVTAKVGLSRAESAELVEQVLGEMSAALAAGEILKLSGFGVFTVRHKSKRVGRNPKTREAVPIEPRRSLTFSASPLLKARINGGVPKPRPRQRRKGPLVLGMAATE